MKSLFFSGFGTIATLMAAVYAMVGLLPADHPFLQPKNSGQFGIRHVVAAAARNLEFKWKYIDRIVVFLTLLTAVVMMVMYIAALALYLLFSPAFAGGFFSPDMFQTHYPNTDIAFMMLDRVFGVPGVFNSDVSMGLYGTFPSNFQLALQGLFEFYSTGLFLISVFLFLYYVVIIAYDLTQDGTPVVQFLKDSWIPVRLVAALGLLLPISDGLNTAQFITLYAAKYGSGMASNAWIDYNNLAGDNPQGLENRELIAKPSYPDVTRLVKDLLLVRACIDGRIYENRFNNDGMFEAKDYLVKGADSQRLLSASSTTGGNWIRDVVNPYTTDPTIIGNLSSDSPTPMASYSTGSDSFVDAMAFYGGGDIRIVFGYKDESGTNEYKTAYPGGVIPLCGEVTIPVTSLTGEGIFTAEAYMYAVLYTVYGMNRDGYNTTSLEDNMDLAVLREFTRISSSYRAKMAELKTLYPSANPNCPLYDQDNDGYESLGTGDTSCTGSQYGDCCADGKCLGKCTDSVDPQYYQIMIHKWIRHVFQSASRVGYDFLTGEITGEDPSFEIGDTYYQNLGFSNPLQMSTGVLQYGWGGAGIWYNKIADRNGSLFAAVDNIPMVSQYPLVMEKVKSSLIKNDANARGSSCEFYDPNKAGNSSIDLPNQKAQFTQEEALFLYRTCKTLHDAEAINIPNTISTYYQNPVKNIIASILGSTKLFNMFGDDSSIFDGNDYVTPLAQLSALGKAILDKTIFNLMSGTGTAAIGGLAHILGGNGATGFNELGNAAGNLANAAFTFAILGMGFGITLHYILPMMPFLYFFFAVGRWVKAIFEAMVGVPLWAMAHLRITGAGLPGPAAMTGYWLILEIFVRPIVTVFALVASFALFSALVTALNSVFPLATANMAGIDLEDLKSPVNPTVFDMSRDIVEQFFLTFLYIVTTYVIGTGCFKLINLIPDSVFRWTASGASAAMTASQDNADDLLQEVGQNMANQSQVIAQQYQGAVMDALYRPAERWGKQAEAEAAAEAAAKAAASKSGPGE